MTPYLFTDDLPRFTLNGPNRSTPLLVKGGSSGTTLLLVSLPSFVCLMHHVVIDR